MIYLCSCLSSRLFFIYPILLLLMVIMISVDVDTSSDFQTIYAELLPSQGESFWTVGKSMSILHLEQK